MISTKKQLSGEFKMKDLGVASQCLGMRIQIKPDSVSLDQEQYTETVLARFGMENSTPVSTPMNSSEPLSQKMCPTTQIEIDQMKNVPYQEAVGALMYLAQSTRPDIVFAVNRLSRFNQNPGPRHWGAVKHLMRYLRGTS